MSECKPLSYGMITVDSTGPVRDALYWVSGVSFYKLSLMMFVFYCLWVFLLVLSVLGTGFTLLGKAAQIDPIKFMSEAPRSKRLKLVDEKMPSNFAFLFNLRRYSSVARTRRACSTWRTTRSPRS